VLGNTVLDRVIVLVGVTVVVAVGPKVESLVNMKLIRFITEQIVLGNDYLNYGRGKCFGKGMGTGGGGAPNTTEIEQYEVTQI
jgi:hypothetical protein